MRPHSKWGTDRIFNWETTFGRWGRKNKTYRSKSLPGSEEWKLKEGELPGRKWAGGALGADRTPRVDYNTGAFGAWHVQIQEKNQTLASHSAGN